MIVSWTTTQLLTACYTIKRLLLIHLVLARVRDFLPLFASSNENLLARAKANPSEVDIENTQGDDRVIEMVSPLTPSAFDRGQYPKLVTDEIGSRSWGIRRTRSS